MASLLGRATQILFTLTAGMVPQHRRFDAVVLVAKLITPVLPLLPRPQRVAPPNWTLPHEGTIETGLWVLDHAQIPYTPRRRMIGGEILTSARDSGRGTLIIGSHGGLNIQNIRALHDTGLDPQIVSVAPIGHVPGLAAPLRTIVRSRTFMFKVRRALMSGESVGAMIDRHDPTERGNVNVEGTGGPPFISSGLIRLAMTCGADIVFIGTRLGAGRTAVTRVERPPASATSPEAVARAFADFMMRHSPGQRTHPDGRSI